jgi:biotin synthase-related radical SAM superfamily protein
VFQDLLTILKKLESKGIALPISVSCQPLNIAEMEKLRDAGVERLGISLDAATKEIFDQVKGVHVNGPYNWEKHHKVLLDAVKIFGKEKATTHLIVGLGETEADVVKVIQWCVDNSIIPALFSFTPIPKTVLEYNPPPNIDLYRRVQLARHLIIKKQTRFVKIMFIKGRITDFGVPKKILLREIADGIPFRTSGCPNCNRPYYNEKPSGPIYNFPIQPKGEDIDEIKQQLQPMLSYKV